MEKPFRSPDFQDDFEDVIRNINKSFSKQFAVSILAINQEPKTASEVKLEMDKKWNRLIEFT